LLFDASHSNPIYGNSDTVQPPAICVNYYIQVYNGTYTPSNVEAAVKDLSNVTEPAQAFKTMTVGWNMPDYSAGVTTVFGEEPYIVPYRCWAMIKLSATESYGWATVNDQYVFHFGGSYNNEGSTMIVLEKGDKVITYGSSYITIFPMKGTDK
jgi:hypothetical protein